MKRCLMFFLVILIGIVVVLATEPGPKLVNINDVDFRSNPGDVPSGCRVNPDFDFGKIPLYFISNQGQVNSEAIFYAKASRYTLWMTKEGLVFDCLRKVKVEKSPANSLKSSYHPGKILRDVSRFLFLNANKNPEIVPIEEAKIRVNYFIGNDKSKWHSNIPTSKAILYKNLYKNIHLKVYGREKQIEYDWIVKPGGNPGDIRIQYKNVKGTRFDKEGNLIIETECGE